MTNIQTLIINSYDIRSQLLIDKLKTVAGSIPVFQDNVTTNVWNKLEGGKDDFYIYDRWSSQSPIKCLAS